MTIMSICIAHKATQRCLSDCALEHFHIGLHYNANNSDSTVLASLCRIQSVFG